MEQSLVNALLSFASLHDDGTPEPRVRYDVATDAVVLTSIEFDLTTREQRFVEDSVRTMGELRDVLGY